MTITNTSFNPHPISNPFTSRLYGNNNRMWNSRGFYRCDQTQQIPKAKMFDMDAKDYWDDVSVPNGETVPMGCEGIMHLMSQFNDDLFQCSDGTLIDMKTKSVISKSKDENGCWGSGTIDMPYEHDQTCGNSDGPMTKKDLEYQRMSQINNNRIMNNLNDEQMELLCDLNDGKINGKSKLVEVY